MPKPGPSLPLNGLFPIAKPSGPTSMRLIDSITPLLLDSKLFYAPDRMRDTGDRKRKRNVTHMGLKIGQGGTLDPLADGVLVIGVNRGTKHLQQFLNCTKEYESWGLLGAATTTYDAEGPTITTHDFDGITRADVEGVLDKFRGNIKQTPPIFSALKMDGKPLYEYARESKPLPRAIPVRDCNVAIDVIDFKPASVVDGDGGHSFSWPTTHLSEEEKDVFRRLTEMVHDASGSDAAADPPAVDLAAPEVPQVSAKTGLRPAAFKVRMTVSSGTYVRSIVHDIGLALGCGAHVVTLSRTRQGRFTVHGDEAEMEKNRAEAVVAYDAFLEAEKAQQAAAAAAAAAAEAEMDEEAMANASSGAAAEEGETFAKDAKPVTDPLPAATFTNPEDLADMSSSAPTTACIPWAVWERAIAQREEMLAQEKTAYEEASENLSAEELAEQFSDAAIGERRRAGPLREWEQHVLAQFEAVEVPPSGGHGHENRGKYSKFKDARGSQQWHQKKGRGGGGGGGGGGGKRG